MRRKRRSLILLTAPLVLASLTWGCGSSEPKPKPKPVPAYTPPPPPPLEDLTREAVEAERVGDVTKSFNAVYGLDEAVRSYQRIVDHYPKSDEAKKAKEKVRTLSKRLRVLRVWKKRIDEIRGKMNNARANPKRLHPLHESLTRMKADAPEGFVRGDIVDLLGKLSEVYEKAALKEVASAAEKAVEARSRGDLREALAAWSTVPEYFTTDLPRVAAEINKHRSGLEDVATHRARKELDRAHLCMRRKQERQALAILRTLWPEYQGFKVAGQIIEREREAAVTLLKITFENPGGIGRKIDVELYDRIEKARALRPDVKADREAIREYLADVEKLFDRYRAALEDMALSPREFEIRKVQIDKLLNRERERLR
ncbi:MAG: hypothetical protein ACYS47_20350 [Planctomycetota bacterium]|jgi:hypothetical protein